MNTDAVLVELGTPFTHLVNDQKYEVIPSFELECGRVLRDVPVAYKTFGKLNATADNVMVICHAFTGSADVEDWYDYLPLVCLPSHHSHIFI